MYVPRIADEAPSVTTVFVAVGAGVYAVGVTGDFMVVGVMGNTQ